MSFRGEEEEEDELLSLGSANEVEQDDEINEENASGTSLDKVSPTPSNEAVAQEDGPDEIVSEQQDSGGGGDAEGESEQKLEDDDNGESIVKSQSTTDINEKNSETEDKISKHDSASQISGSKTSSKRSIQSQSRGEGEGSTKTGNEQSISGKESARNSSNESISSGFAIVTQILEELIEKVVKIHEGDGLEKDSMMSQDAKLSSILTIKSLDEQGSGSIDSELHAQLIFEQETAVLKRQEIFQENVARYHSLVISRVHLKRKNVFLLKQMFEHYKRKQMEHLFKEVTLASADIEVKLTNALLAYEEAKREAVEEELKMQRQVSSLEEKRETIELELDKEWDGLISREREVSKGIILQPAMKHASDKQSAESLIQKQIAKSQEVTRERLSYFRLRDIVASDESRLKSLENLDEDLTLMEYEQLKMQSQSCVEKLEERDADLHRLRSKATSAIQILAEIREKTHTLQEDIEASRVILHDVNQNLLKTRERVACEKKRRDMSRSDTVRLRQEAGLVSEPRLSQDYKESLLERDNRLEQLQDWKSKFESQKKNLLNLRRELATVQH